MQHSFLSLLLFFTVFLTAARAATPEEFCTSAARASLYSCREAEFRESKPGGWRIYIYYDKDSRLLVSACRLNQFHDEVYVANFPIRAAGRWMGQEYFREGQSTNAQLEFFLGDEIEPEYLNNPNRPDTYEPPVVRERSGRIKYIARDADLKFESSLICSYR